MGRIVVTAFSSLDGVVEAPGGEEFAYEGWSFEFDRGDEGEQFKIDEAMAADALLIGRVTYEGFAAASTARSRYPAASGSSTTSSGTTWSTSYGS